VSGVAPPRDRERTGRRAEAVAGWWLRLKGFELLATRWRAKVGEIDLVCRRGELVVFVEVKRRGTLAAAAEALTAANRERVARAAAHYLARHPELAACDLRFDAVLLAPWSPPRHLRGAWDGDGVTAGSRTARAPRRAPR
jgi:putative endonuclease